MHARARTLPNLIAATNINSAATARACVGCAGHLSGVVASAVSSAYCAACRSLAAAWRKPLFLLHGRGGPAWPPQADVHTWQHVSACTDLAAGAAAADSSWAGGSEAIAASRAVGRHPRRHAACLKQCMVMKSKYHLHCPASPRLLRCSAAGHRTSAPLLRPARSCVSSTRNWTLRTPLRRMRCSGNWTHSAAVAARPRGWQVCA